jgi:hypothetical protein
MGVSISVTGAVASEAARREILAWAGTRSAELEWTSRRIDRSFKNARLRIGRTMQALEMTQMTGVSLLPHFACEEIPLVFLAGDGTLVEEVVETRGGAAPVLLSGVLVKTQFAGPAVHREVCEFLAELKRRHAPELVLDDESGFSATGDAKALEHAFVDGWREIRDKVVADRPGPGSTFQVGEFLFEVPAKPGGGEFDGLNEKQREFLLSCEIAGVAQISGFGTKLDRSRGSVADLELAISDVDDDVRTKDLARPEVQDLALMAGACFGRALAAILGATWRVDDGQFLLTDVARTGLVVDPFEIARDRIQRGPPYSFLHHLDVFDTIAANLARDAAT